MGQELDKVLDSLGSRVVNRAKENISNRGISSSGRLSRSLKFEVSNGTVSFFMEDYGIDIDAGKKGTLSSPSNPGSIFEQGKASRPSITSIKKWINTKPVKFSGENSRLSVDSMAFLISRSVHRKGIKATMFFSDAFISKFENLPDKAVEAVADDMIEKMKQTLKGFNPWQQK